MWHVTKILFSGIKPKIFSVFLSDKLTLTATSGKELNDHGFSSLSLVQSTTARKGVGESCNHYKLMWILRAITEVHSRCERSSFQRWLLVLEALKSCGVQESQERSGILCTILRKLFKLPYKIGITNHYFERWFCKSYAVKTLAHGRYLINADFIYQV